MMKGAKSSCESLPPPPPPPPPNNHNLPVDQQWSHMPMAISGGNVHPNVPQHYFKGFRAGDLQELGKIPRLRQLDVTHSRNLKMTFNDDLENNGPKVEPNKGAGQDPGPSNMGSCPPQLNGAPGECSEIRNLPHSMDFVVSYGGSNNAPSPTEFHSQPTPPPYQGHPQAAPPPAVPHDISLSCDDMSKCTVM
ncbi:hypothetical protein O6P43_007059 [Quillaja saponaria]|uniref:Uncharacterized protein n=1 Tax=Quillaja saponaria TaxID=32244 RepID=A0AAD7QAM3_QUISA|nr:hypothetical protein O6P43_007059 [Quillaja saponaria]